MRSLAIGAILAGLAASPLCAQSLDARLPTCFACHGENGTSQIPETPDAKTLDRAPNPQADTDYVARFTAPEFTSICPVTGQPDFAHLVIDYAPDKWIVESKSLKLYLWSFRNHGAFHEDCTVMIGKRITSEIKPKYFRIGGYWYPRGGIPIDVFWQTGRLPKDMWVPDQGVAPYRGRG